METELKALWVGGPEAENVFRGIVNNLQNVGVSVMNQWHRPSNKQFLPSWVQLVIGNREALEKSEAAHIRRMCKDAGVPFVYGWTKTQHTIEELRKTKILPADECRPGEAPEPVKVVWQGINYALIFGDGDPLVPVVVDGLFYSDVALTPLTVDRAIEAAMETAYSGREENGVHWPDVSEILHAFPAASVESRDPGVNTSKNKKQKQPPAEPARKEEDMSANKKKNRAEIDGSGYEIEIRDGEPAVRRPGNNRLSRPLIIEDQLFPSFTAAAEELDIGISTISGALSRGKSSVHGLSLHVPTLEEVRVLWPRATFLAKARTATPPPEPRHPPPERRNDAEAPKLFTARVVAGGAVLVEPLVVKARLFDSREDMPLGLAGMCEWPDEAA